MGRVKIAAIFPVVLIALACAPAVEQVEVGEAVPDAGPSAPVPSTADLDRARAAADALSAELAGQLFAELERSGPLGAIDVCSRVAQETARSFADETLSVRRVSSRVRNPADEPDDWERSQLALLERGLESGELPDEVVSVEKTASGHELRYLRPLRIAPPCLSCHGEPGAMDAELVERIRELYPNDLAVGYEPGDLRGAVSVRLSLGNAGSSSGES